MTHMFQSLNNLMKYKLDGIKEEIFVNQSSSDKALMINSQIKTFLAITIH